MQEKKKKKQKTCSLKVELVLNLLVLRRGRNECVAKPNLLAQWKAIFQSRPKTSTINHPPISDVYSLMRENHIPDSWFISSLWLQINGCFRLEMIASFLHLLRNWAGVCNNICLSLIFRSDVSPCVREWAPYMQCVYYMMWSRRSQALLVRQVDQCEG